MKHAMKLTLAIAAAAFTAPPVSMAQEGADDTIALDEVIVSARKRSESLQDVPIAVDVFNEMKLELLGIDNVEELARYTPSLTYDRGVLPMDTRPVIRGATAQRGRPNVGILVDYVDVSSESLTVAGGGITSNLRLLDLERVEIIKGPQNALYGRSAFTGAINYVTKRPSDSFSGKAKVDVNEHDAYEVGLSASGPLIENKLNGRVAFSYIDDPGYYENPNTGGELGSLESLGASLSLDWQINDSLNSYLRVEYTDDEATPQAEVFVQSISPQFDPMVNFLGTGTVTDAAIQYPHLFPADCNGIDRLQPNWDTFGMGPTCRALVPGEQSAGESQIQLSADPRTGSDFEGTDVDNTRIHFDVTGEFGELDFKYIMGYTDSSASIQEDFDKSTTTIVSVPFGPFPFSQYGLSAMAQQQIDTEQWNHEIRLSGEGERIRWMLSLLHWSEDMDAEFDDEWWLRDGGDPALVLGLLNGPGGPFNYLSQPVGPFPNFCVLFYPGDPGCVPAITTLATGPGNTPFIPLGRETSHNSIAALVSFDVTDTLEISVEGRWLDENIDYSGGAADIANFSQFGQDPYWGFMFGPGELTYNSVNESEFVPKITANWSFAENMMLYGSYAESFKPGGISTTDANGDVTTGEYKPEDLDAYEIGFKSDFRDRSIRLNAAYYFYDYTDQQVPYQFFGTNGLLQTTVTNAGETEIKGWELDLTWNSAFIDGLSANLSYTYTDAEFTSFNLSEILAEIGGTPNAFNRVKAGNNEADFTGKTPPHTAENVASASIRYDANLSSGMSLFGELFAVYTDERFIGEGNVSTLPDHTLLDFYGGLVMENWAITAYVVNLSDEDAIRSGLGNVDYGLLPDGRSVPQALSLYLPQPRTTGLRVEYNFGN